MDSGASWWTLRDTEQLTEKTMEKLAAEMTLEELASDIAGLAGLPSLERVIVLVAQRYALVQVERVQRAFMRPMGTLAGLREIDNILTELE